jgi:lipoyl(octanoyl) transferase
MLCAELGLVNYEDAHVLQLGLVAARSSGTVASDIVLLTEHAPVFTLGRRGGRGNLTVPEVLIEEAQIPIVHAERGGDITFHGPGQLVVYLILDLRAAKLTVTGYVERLEEVMIRTAAHFGVHAARSPLNRGIWAGGRKLGSLGIAIRRGVAFHGFALNVNVSLEPFGWINPCGLHGIKMTSIEREIALDRSPKAYPTSTGSPACEPSMKEVREQVKTSIKDLFNVDLVQGVPASCSMSCVRMLDRDGGSDQRVLLRA